MRYKKIMRLMIIRNVKVSQVCFYFPPLVAPLLQVTTFQVGVAFDVDGYTLLV